MSVADALSYVENAPDGDADVERFREQMRTFVQSHPDALHRTCLDGHFTASALIVHADGVRVLLMHHTKLQRWLQPGGHVDGDGDLARAALREAWEETGMKGLLIEQSPIDLDVHRIPARGEEPEHDHLDVRFLVRAPHGAKISANHESTDMRWFGFDEVADLGLDTGLHRMLRAGQVRLAT